jgi:transposase-like protein
MWMRNPLRFYKTSPDVIRLAVMMYIRFPLSLRQVEDLLHERGIDVSYETVREISKKRSASVHEYHNGDGISIVVNRAGQRRDALPLASR